MDVTRISTGSPFEAEIGYSRAVSDGTYVFVAGTTGFDYRTMAIADDVVAQAEQAFKTVAEVLREAGTDLSAVVRVRFLVPRREDFERCMPVIRRHLENARPAATMMVVGLADPRMKIEIEVTARCHDVPSRE